MKFNQPYNRNEFLNFLRTSFLPEDFTQEETRVENPVKFQYTQQVTRLGECESLGLVVYEVRHSSMHDARVGLTKEAFRLLADEFCERALIFFVPQDDDSNYRFSLIEITLEQKADSAKVGRKYSNPHRYSYFLGKGIAYYTPNKYLNEAGRVVNIDDLRGRFSVEVLTKAFYQELSDWYAWAVKIVRFPNDLKTEADNEKYNAEAMIRLITRLIFVWFIKQRKLVPDEFFDVEYISSRLIKNFDPYRREKNLLSNNSVEYSLPRESHYYKGILQNLFFAMLNSPITPEGKDIVSERRFSNGRGDYDNNKLMRHMELFKNPDLFVELANKYVPFLNGGLFDCLDDKDNDIYIDAFTDRQIISKQLVVPDGIFFGEEHNIDLSEWYGDAKKKKVSARGIIDILKRYNFTVEENTPFDQEVSLDPELLGKVFENLLASYNPETQTTARKQTGSFYTPREIVQYMVDESLIAHLKRTVGDDLEPEYRKLTQYTDEPLNLTAEQKKSIMQSLYNCKVLDPACGSGAFPMGMLQQMVHILNRIDPDNVQWKEMMLNTAISETSEAYQNASDEERAEMVADIERSFNESINRPDYARKLYLIENSIYGVDIQPIAIQISKLRFFISLVVDQKTNDNPIDNFGIRPLPNLEAKFVAANTLIGLEKKDTNLFDSPEIKQKEKELKEAKHRIFGAKTVKTKRKYKERVTTLRAEIADMLKESGFIGNEDAQQLAQWDMFDQNAASPFFDPEWMFGIGNGFDVVIGNPPYIPLQDNKGLLADIYKNKNFKVFDRGGDIYSLFYEQGTKLLQVGGVLTYKTSSQWLRAGYGKKLREYLSVNLNPYLLIDFTGVKVFDATVDPCVILLLNENNNNKTIATMTKPYGKEILPELGRFVAQNASECSFTDGEGWIILSKTEQILKNKIKASGTPLKKFGINIYRGILTGFNDAFIIPTEKRNEILSNCDSGTERKHTEELIKPLLRGRDIRKYRFVENGLFQINTHNGVKNGGVPRIKIEDYPAVKKHLDSFLEKLSKRSDKGDTPYNLRNCAYLIEFSKPKIIYPETTVRRSEFYYDESGILLDKTCFFMSGNNMKFIQGILTSTIIEWYLERECRLLGKKTIQYSKQWMENIPIPSASPTQQQPIIAIVENILASKKEDPQADTREWEEEIDRLVYDLYGLTEEEIKIIENNF